ncbi:MAG: 16S rRNA (cytosine(1402)-N(4))-methyltransferase RsmH, partial [Rhodococcus sp.]|nr:16S rRNA (cytosine(1402)-N(4))-methyltransferase RsmH [Rhodococcus sp. (in: high G+C Gram-positive bacteria)]
MVDEEVSPSPSAAGFGHVPVMASRCIELLRPAITAENDSGAGAVFVDGTLGLGGHSEQFLSVFPELRLIGLDRDPNALAIAGDRLARFGDRVTLVRTRYDGIGDALVSAGLESTGSVTAALFDLGVSSMQLDEADRGFAYSVDAPLDMRMDPTSGITAADVLNTYSHGDLARILKTYGEERFAGKIASEVIRQRERAPFTTSAELVELLYRTIPAATRRTGGHPAKRTFQALRVEVNSELDSLSAAVPAALDSLALGGRAVFMSYQSL